MLSALLLRFFIHADQKHGQFGRQFLRQLAFISKLLPNRYLHLATQSRRPFARMLAVRCCSQHLYGSAWANNALDTY